MTDETTEETAGLYLLGVLDDSERAAVAQRIASDPAMGKAVDTWSRRLAPLLDAVPQVAPPPSVWQAIQSRIATARPPARRRDEGSWIELAPGADMRMLLVEPVTGVRSAIVRMAAGSEVPDHDHPEMEECFIVDGIVEIDGTRYQPGDHVISVAGTRHETIKAVTKVTLLLHWSAALA